MYNLIKADLYKLKKSKAVKILILITAICAVIAAFLSYEIKHGKFSAASTNGIVFMFSDTNIIGILGAVTAGIIICGDFENRTVHEALADGFGRGQITLSKAISYFYAVILILLPFVIVISVMLITGYKFSMGNASSGFMHILTEDGGKAISSYEVLKLIFVMAALMIVYIGQLSICVPLSILFKKPVIVVAVYYGLIILLANLSALRNSSKLIDILFSCTPYGTKYNLLTLKTGTGDIIKSVFVSIIYTIVMIFITYMGFRKSEIK